MANEKVILPLNWYHAMLKKEEELFQLKRAIKTLIYIKNDVIKVKDINDEDMIMYKTMLQAKASIEDALD